MSSRQRSEPVWDGHRRQVLVVLLVAAAYYAGGLFGLAVRVPPSRIAIIWPPNAILLAALLLSPPRLWPWYMAAVLPAHLHVTALFGSGVPIVTALCQYIGNIAQALLAAILLWRIGNLPLRFDDLRGAGLFILLAAFAAPAVASAFVAYLHTLTGWVSDYWLAWQQRLLNNVVSTLTLTPLVILFFSHGITGLRRVSVRRFIELAALVLAVFAVAFAIFGWKSAGHQAVPALLYALLPMLLWVAVRFEPVCIYGCLLLVALVSLISAYYGRGPFPTLSRAENVLALQLFLVAISVPLILLTALVQERARTERALRESQQRYSLATAAGSVSVWDWKLKTGEFFLDPSLKALLGFQDHEIDNTLADWTKHLHPDDHDRVLSLVRAHLAGTAPVFEAEHRAFHKNGSVCWLFSRGVAAEYADGVPVRVIGTSTDVSARKQTEQELRQRSGQIRLLAGRLISAQEEERRRIAHHLQDDLSQKVAALATAMSNLNQYLPAGAVSIGVELAQLQARTSDLVNDIRALSHEIHPAALEHAGLIPALISFATELKRLEGIDVDLTLPEVCADIPQPVATCIYRVAQESMRNVVKHSGAQRARLTLAVVDDAITLVIRDEGLGFDVMRARENRGLGLTSIEERVRLLNGHAEVMSQPGRGTTIRVALPLAAEPAAAAAAERLDPASAYASFAG